MTTTINDLSYAEMVDMLDAELTAVAAILKGLSDEEWGRTSPLRPVEEALPHWTVREVASHFDVSIGLTLALIAGQDDVQAARDRTSFFINPRSETAPVVYEYAYLNPRVSQYLLIKPRRRPRPRGRLGFLAGWPAQGMGCEISRR